MTDSSIPITAGTGTNVDTRTTTTSGDHRQVIVIGAPATDADVAPVDATSGLKVNLGADNDITGTVTAELSAVDKAVLDTIDAVLDTIKVDTEAIETAVEAIQAGQLADGHNVTVDNASIAVTNATAANLKVDGSDVTQPVSGTVTATPSVTGGGTEALAQRVTIANDSTGVLSIDDNGGSLTVDNGGTFAVQEGGAALTSLQLLDDTVYTNNSGNISKVIGVAGYAGVDTPIALHVDGSGNMIVVDGGGSITVDASELTTLAGAVSGTEMQVDIVASLPAGTNAIGKLSANSGVDIGDVDVTSISAGSNLIGDVGIQGRTAGGLSTYYDADLDETAIAVKAGAGTVYAIEAFNTTDAPLFLQLFNVAQGSVTVGTTTPTNQWVIPGNANSDGAGFTFNVPQGIAYGTAITAACSTNSEGNAAPGAGACIINVHYK